jgi:hypothetical protein
MMVALAAAITAGLVVIFLRNLPPPPRFDDLRIEPGSAVPSGRSILRRLWIDDAIEPATMAVDDVAFERWPTGESGRPAVRLRYDVPVERAETTFARFLVEGAAAQVTISRGSRAVLVAGGDADFEAESPSVVISRGASDIEIEIVRSEVAGLPRVRVVWIEVADDEDGAVGDGEHRSLSTLFETGGT